MVALTARRSTARRTGDARDLPVKANTKLFAGGMAAVTSTGVAVPMAAALLMRGIGRVENSVDNTGGADGAVKVRVADGIFQFTNSAAADAITAADIGADCYGVDDQTVAKTSATSTRSIAGKVYDVDALGVWVKF